MKLSTKLALLMAMPVLGAAPFGSALAETTAAPNADPQALALGQELVTIAFPPERRQDMMDKITGSVIQQMKAGMPLDEITDTGLRKLLLDYIDSVPTVLRPTTTAFLPKQMDAIAQAYARMFTPAQLRDIVAFARTPSGQEYLQRSADILSDPAVAAANTEYFRQVQQINKANSAALAQKVAAYIKAHPDAAPKR